MMQKLQAVAAHMFGQQSLNTSIAHEIMCVNARIRAMTEHASLYHYLVSLCEYWISGVKEGCLVLACKGVE